MTAVRGSRDVTFCNESNRPEKYDLEDYEDYPVEEIKRLDKKIDLLISQTRLYTPPNRFVSLNDSFDLFPAVNYVT